MFVTGTTSVRVKGGLMLIPTASAHSCLAHWLTPVPPKTCLLGKQGHGVQGHRLDRKRNNVVLSCRAVVEAPWRRTRQTDGNLREGSIVTGVVKNITEYGAFVTSAASTGLLHITDMAGAVCVTPPKWWPPVREITRQVPQVRQSKNTACLWA